MLLMLHPKNKLFMNFWRPEKLKEWLNRYILNTPWRLPIMNSWRNTNWYFQKFLKRHSSRLNKSNSGGILGKIFAGTTGGISGNITTEILGQFMEDFFSIPCQIGKVTSSRTLTGTRGNPRVKTLGELRGECQEAFLEEPIENFWRNNSKHFLKNSESNSRKNPWRDRWWNSGGICFEKKPWRNSWRSPWKIPGRVIGAMLLEVLQKCLARFLLIFPLGLLQGFLANSSCEFSKDSYI